MSQSGDAYHTVTRPGIVMPYPNLRKTMGDAVHQLCCIAGEFRDVIKMGRTVMRDTMPIETGCELFAWTRQLESDWNYLEAYGSDLRHRPAHGAAASVLGSLPRTLRAFLAAERTVLQGSSRAV